MRILIIYCQNSQRTVFLCKTGAAGRYSETIAQAPLVGKDMNANESELGRGMDTGSLAKTEDA